jgi:hypothetical protein
MEDELNQGPIIHRERRKQFTVIPEDLIEDIAERASEKAIIKMEERLYQSVGKTFLDKLFKFIGIVIVAAAFYLHNKGYLTLER